MDFERVSSKIALAHIYVISLENKEFYNKILPIFVPISLE